MSKVIGTHSGTFHCDESLACFILRKTELFQDAKVIRSRDPEVLKTADILVDVGAVYDPEKNLFDHHQRGFEHTMNESYTIKLSSSGLIYKHFGREAISNILQERDNSVIEKIFWKVYDEFILPIDAIDNGVTQGDNLRYSIRTDLSSRVSYLNPEWNDEPIDLDSQFEKAIELTGTEFEQSVRHFYRSWLPARSIVENAVRDRKNIHPSGKIIELDQFCPWSSHLEDLEKELKIEGEILYLLFSDGNSWRIRAVPVTPSSFESRKALPEPWRGKRDAQLSEETQIPGCIFIHASGFIGGHSTKEGALALAVKALEF